ncbi:protein of unknown function [Taphrina deformans PYCC 5710]|uniref:Rho GDP-dissociation inhibitor n=1 Tax=Taphrina deformans (strain PYCC 5710 / ATCC 11124 / CBS 356.35 / IMI 108563 / JCM 9778 / NBRC 8474) TaxID=1097556 RepID=R4XKM6_TAPDE|nr:protein of unknown function [Taphrina deformans PYCC 5710]|eukprot:CCG83869.1 protein of unknown function [Taphrina deformans PYCC 5710]
MSGPASKDDFEDTEAGYVPTGEQKTVEEYAKLDANDESLAKWKASLGITAGGGPIIHDSNNPAKVLIENITLKVAGRPDVSVSLSAPGSTAKLASEPFVIKEGVRYAMVLQFRVQREVVSGLRYLQVVKRKGIKVDKFEEMVGSYGPSKDVYTKKLAEEEAPSGMLARGEYKARSRFIDDDKVVHLDFEWAIVISKDWK